MVRELIIQSILTNIFCFFIKKKKGKRSTSVALEKALSLLSPKPALTQQQIQQQQEHEAAERKKRWKGTIGIFVLNGFLAIPEQKFFLNVFEPRYLLLVNRSIDNDVPFAVQSGSTKSHGILVKVSKVISQRPFVIECTVVDRYVATSEMKIEPDSAGLFIRDVEVIRDDPINEEEMKVCTTLASQIFNEAISKVDANQRKYLEAVIGPIPVTCTQDLTNELFLCNFSFWLIASLAWVNNQDRDLALASTSLMYRFQKINDNLSNSIHKLGARFNVQQ